MGRMLIRSLEKDILSGVLFEFGFRRNTDFDNGMLSVNPDTHSVTHTYDDHISSTQIVTQDDHHIISDFLKYHNEVVVE